MENSGVTLTGLSFTWSIITQCLAWEGVVSWSWMAIWLPTMIFLGIALLLALITVISS